jgi:putative FmdB family regulatory protein
MPTYDYRCPNGHDFEHFFRKISDATAELACPTCGAVAQRRVSGGAGLVFKGSGFYLTDYGKNAHRKGSDASASAESKGEASAESKSSSSESTKSDSGASSTKSESASATKPESSKSAEPKTSAPKTKGGDSK